ncbi:EXOC4 [Mytilus edulis]|uniref:Exocyst complex component Sec8 n=1 Tax=Mytilus edulis TaxID=6550 RepID=A0A8S3S4A8_MYTED|nr:EXOC4 [Mytilus edulis]
MTDEWLKIGNYSVFPWSISGVETCVVIKTNGPTLTFDLGYSCRSSVSSNLVFFSHGHMDHISGIAQHAAKRSLYGMKPAKYYSPVHLVEPLTSLCKMCRNLFAIQQNLTNITMARETDLDHARQYYELLYMNPDDVLSLIVEKGPDYSYTEYVSLFQLYQKSHPHIKPANLDTLLHKLEEVMNKTQNGSSA